MCSPLFIIGTVGISIFNSRKIGYILFIIHIVTILTYILLNRNHFSKSYTAYPFNKEKCNSPFITAIRESSFAMLNITAYIVFFSVISEFILTFLPINSDILIAIICGITELTNGTVMIALTTIPAVHKLAITALMIGFSGLCVTLQTLDIISDTKIRIMKYISGKIIIAILMFLVSLIVFTILPQSINVFNDCSATIKNNIGYIFWSAFIPSMILLFYITKN